MSVAESLLSLVLRAQYALAANGLPEAPIKPPKSVGIASEGPTGIVCLGLKWLFTAAIIFSIVLAFMAAFDYMRSSGDPAKLKSATNRLVFVAIGIAVAIAARSLPVLVGSLIGAGESGDTSSLCP